MFRKILILISVVYLNSIIFISKVIAEDNVPVVNCIGLPGCVDTNKESPGSPVLDNKVTLNWIGNIIGEAIQYVAVMAVISLMIAGIFYITSGGEEEKTKKAKTWIIWSLVGVLVSISAWGMIEIINNINIS